MTEVSFLIMPTRPDEETKAAIEEELVVTLRDVETIGKASGAAIGWGELLYVRQLCFVS